MNAFEQLLRDLEAKRDITYMEARDAQMKADTLDYAVIMLKNAIYLDRNVAKDALAKEA